MKLRIQLSANLSWHQSRSIDKLNQRRVETKAGQLKYAVEWCRENGCSGYLVVLKSGNFPLVKDARTINKRLDNMKKQIIVCKLAHPILISCKISSL